MVRDLANDTLLTQSAATQTAAASNVNGAVVDMAGWDGVLFFVKYSTAAADNTIKCQQGTDGSVSDAADLADSEVAVGASDELVWLQITHPQERYLRPVYERGTSTVLEWAGAIQFKGSTLPGDNTVAGTIAGLALDFPAEGTA